MKTHTLILFAFITCLGCFEREPNVSISNQHQPENSASENGRFQIVSLGANHPISQQALLDTRTGDVWHLQVDEDIYLKSNPRKYLIWKKIDQSDSSVHSENLEWARLEWSVYSWNYAHDALFKKHPNWRIHKEKAEAILGTTEWKTEKDRLSKEFLDVPGREKVLEQIYKNLAPSSTPEANPAEEIRKN